eukprot:scaffold12377_cov119-Isochrysis_galbana.AAC.2
MRTKLGWWGRELRPRTGKEITGVGEKGKGWVGWGGEAGVGRGSGRGWGGTGADTEAFRLSSVGTFPPSARHLPELPSLALPLAAPLTPGHDPMHLCNLLQPGRARPVPICRRADHAGKRLAQLLELPGHILLYVDAEVVAVGDGRRLEHEPQLRLLEVLGGHRRLLAHQPGELR